MIINASNGTIAAGRATRDAELKTVGDKGTHLAKFSIVGIDGTQEKPTVFVNVIAWFDLADYAEAIRKGDRVFVAGMLKNADYINKDGELVKKNELVADFIQVQCKEDASNTSGINSNASTYTEVEDDNDLPW